MSSRSRSRQGATEQQKGKRCEWCQLYHRWVLLLSPSHAESRVNDGYSPKWRLELFTQTNEHQTSGKDDVCFRGPLCAAYVLLWALSRGLTMVSSAVIRPLARALARTRPQNQRAMSLATYQRLSSPLTTRAFSSAQPSSADEATPATPFAHKVDEHVEEQKRRRLSDVSTFVCILLTKGEGYYPRGNTHCRTNNNTASQDALSSLVTLSPLSIFLWLLRSSYPKCLRRSIPSDGSIQLFIEHQPSEKPLSLALKADLVV